MNSVIKTKLQFNIDFTVQIGYAEVLGIRFTTVLFSGFRYINLHTFVLLLTFQTRLNIQKEMF